MTEATASPGDIDRWTRHLWHTSQHNRMVIALGGRVQRVVHEMREAAGLPPFGWNTAFPDAEFGECTVHAEGCRGQEHHPDFLRDYPNCRTAIGEAAVSEEKP